MKKIYVCAILLIISIHFKVPLLWAGTTGKISGVITDAETGQVLPGVNVMAIGTTLGAATDRDGYFAILNVAISVPPSLSGGNIETKIDIFIFAPIPKI